MSITYSNFGSIHFNVGIDLGKGVSQSYRIVPIKPHKPHWYKITIHTCPVCGDGPSHRERMYTPRPEKRDERIEYVSIYDNCLGYL